MEERKIGKQKIHSFQKFKNIAEENNFRYINSKIKYLMFVHCTFNTYSSYSDEGDKFSMQIHRCR